MDQLEAREALRTTAIEAVDLARRLGADQAEAGVSYEEGLSVTVRLGELESVERQRDRGLAVTVYREQRKGSASTAALATASVEEVVRKALSIASFTAADRYGGLADADLMAHGYPDLDLCHPWSLDVTAAEAIALETEDAARALDARISNSEGATVSTSVAAQAYANSHGFAGAFTTSNHSISCSVVAGQDGSLERDYWFTLARSRDELDAAAEVGREAARRTLRRLGAKQIATTRMPVLYPAYLARGLFGHLVAAIRGTSQYRKATFLLDACGEQIFSRIVDVDEEPLLPGALGSAPYDSEGVATRARALVAGGVLQGYVLSSYSARRLGLKTTGNAGGVHNLIVRPTVATAQELLEAHPRLFLVNELLGQGVNTVTGDYSRGAAGFLVERGEIVQPVHEVTIAGSLAELFKRIEAIGPDVDRRGAIRSGSVLVEELTIAGS
ncbi:MAG TPA: metalloprotease PmbA [Gammaproteobacteria bacterium]|nr:metalloprotease PmbA [Gammaproteobacteria bacterium]